jgi:glycosyltransferase involved in cell wall biosynthesis
MVDRLEVGGVEKVAIQQVAALRAIGHDAELLVLRGAGDGFAAFADLLARIPVRVLERRLPRALRRSRPIPGFAFLQTFHFTHPLLARRLLRAGEVDAILCHGSYTAFTAFAAGRARGVPVALVLWDPTRAVVMSPAYDGRAIGRLRPALLPVARWLDRRLVRRAGLVVLGGLPYADYVRALGPRGLLVAHPAAEPVDRALDASERRPEVLAATAWKPGKHPERLLPIVERHADLRLVLAGAWLDEVQLAGFRDEVRRRGLEDRVELTGRIGEDELARRYAAARFVIQAWPSPGFGLSPLEAAANGTTFAIPREQGSAEVFRDGVDGLLFDLGREGDLLRAADRLAADPELAARMGASALERVREVASWEARARELAAALARLAA